jgi:UDP-N-acetylglucosamine 1-carboxyvinyltransferase
MDALKIYGGEKLSGEVNISGAKNSALPLIASTILSKNSVNMTNVPNVADIRTLLKLLSRLGGEHTFIDKNSIKIDSTKIDQTTATYDIVKTMRASILVLGPLLSRFRSCEVSLPGGCAIGARPVDIHLKALEEMGAIINIEGGYIKASAPEGLKGADIEFEKKTVTGTENIVMAAALAFGVTNLSNCALEPEVVQTCEVLRDAGVEIDGIGTENIRVVGTGGELLNFKDIRVIPDRIEAGTYLCAGAITKSEITVANIEPKHIQSTLDKLEEMGFNLEISSNKVKISPSENLKPVDIVTAEFPLFPTDMQAQFVALATQIEGSSIIEERLFENRFMHVNELQRLGADIEMDRNQVQITGVNELIGADVMATDLRASSALVLAGLVAKGLTLVHRIYHLDRGYESLEEKLRGLGAKVERVRVTLL